MCGIGNEPLLAMLKSTLSKRPDAKLIEILNLARELGTIYDEKQQERTPYRSERQRLPTVRNMQKEEPLYRDMLGNK